MDLPDVVVQNLMVLAANALAGKPHQGEPEQMAELWQNVAQAKKYLAERAESSKEADRLAGKQQAELNDRA